MSSAQPLEVSSQPIEASLQYQTRRANLLTDLVRILAEKPPLPKILDKVAEQSAGVLGDAAFIVLSTDGKLRLEVLFCPDRERIVRSLIAAWKAKGSGQAGQMFHEVWAKGEGILIEDLRRHAVAEEMKSVIEHASLSSLIAVPIRKRAEVIG